MNGPGSKSLKDAIKVLLMQTFEHFSTEPLLQMVNNELDPSAYQFCRSELRLMTFNMNYGYDTSLFTSQHEMGEVFGTSIFLSNTGQV
jgi:hypothetical protein